MNNKKNNFDIEKTMNIIAISFVALLAIASIAVILGINRPKIDTSNVDLSKYEFTNTDKKIIEYVKTRENKPLAYFKNEYTLTTHDIEEYLNKGLDKANTTDKKIEIEIKGKGQNIYLDGFKIPVDSIIKYSNPDNKNTVKYVIPSIYLAYRDKDLSNTISFREYYDRWYQLMGNIVKEFSTDKLHDDFMNNAIISEKPVSDFHYIVFDYNNKNELIEYLIVVDAENEKIYLTVSEASESLSYSDNIHNKITLFEFDMDLENNTYSVIQKFDDIPLEKIKLISKEEVEHIEDQKKINRILDIN